MKLTKVKIADLQPHKENYNRHSDAQITELVKSLDAFSQFKNIVVSHGVILAGHGLVEAAKRKGLTEVYALIRDDLTDDEQKALLIADNALPFLALPDAAALESLLAGVVMEIPGVTNEFLNRNGLNNNDDFDAEKEWDDIAEFNREALAVRTLYIHFKTNEDVELFAKTINQTFTDKTKFLWFPKNE